MVVALLDLIVDFNVKVEIIMLCVSMHHSIVYVSYVLNRFLIIYLCALLKLRDSRNYKISVLTDFSGHEDFLLFACFVEPNDLLFRMS